MFRSLSGFKARYQDLILLVVSEFDEWKVLVYSPAATIHGQRQFKEAKAKEHALTVAQTYLKQIKNQEPPPVDGVEWKPTDPDDWLIWRA